MIPHFSFYVVDVSSSDSNWNPKKMQRVLRHFGLPCHEEVLLAKAKTGSGPADKLWELPRDLLVARGEQEDFNPGERKMPNRARPSFGTPVVCRKLGFWHSPVLPPPKSTIFLLREADL
jgi:hypothetical protein